VSHSFARPWRRIEKRGSFKSSDRQANLQLTFATNSDHQLLIDLDIDDHQVLVALQGIDPGYSLA